MRVPQPSSSRLLVAHACCGLLLLGWGAVAVPIGAPAPELAARLFAMVALLSLWTQLGSWCSVADGVTRGRGLLLCGAFLWAGEAPAASGGWLLWTLLAAAVLADLLDGWAARRFGGSEQGALLDMETDQLTTFVLAWLGAAKVGPWLLLLPAFRYGYVLAGSWWLGLPVHDPKPRAGDNRQAKLLCALVMAAQLTLLAPIVPLTVAQGLGALAVAALVWSFGSDLVWLLHTRMRRPV